MNLFTFSGVIIAFSCLLYFFIILVFGKTKLHKIWALFNLAIGIWGVGSYLVGTSKYFNDILWAWRIAYLGALFTCVFFYHTVFIFCNLRNRKFLSFVYIQAVFFAYLTLQTNLIFQESHLIKVFNSLYYFHVSVPNFILLSFWLFVTVFSHYELFRYTKIIRGIKRMQALYFLYSSMVGFFGGFFSLAPSFGINVYPVCNFLIFIYPPIITYAIFRYRLMDFSLVLTRTTVFVFVYSLILGIPLVIIYYLQNQLVALLGLSWWIAPFLCSTALATLGPFLYIYFNKKAEDRLLKEQKNYQNILKSASAGMIRAKNLGRLLNLIVHLLTKTVRIEHVTIYLLDDENNRYILQASRGRGIIAESDRIIDVGSPLIWKLLSKKEPIVTEEAVMQLHDESQSHDLAKFIDQLFAIKASLIIPSFVENRLIGILVLGEKRSGKLYSQDDLAVFSVLANQMAIAVENILSFEELKGAKTQINHLEKLAAVGKLAHAVAHEINNPLAAIKTFTEHLENNYDDQGYRTKFKRIVCSEIDRISHVVSHLFNLSKQRMPQLQHHVDIHQLLDSVVMLLGQELTRRGISLIKNYESDVVFLEVDPDQLKQCFLNLILNSMQALEGRQERREVVISTHRLNQKRFCITIFDTGKGIAEDDMPRIFEPFFTTKNDGHGVGLSIVSDIIKAHGGEIKVESKLGAGATFNVELPLQKTAA